MAGQSLAVLGGDAPTAVVRVPYFVSIAALAFPPLWRSKLGTCQHTRVNGVHTHNRSENRQAETGGP